MEKRTRNKVTDEQRNQIIELWVNGAGKVPEVAKAVGVPVSTAYGVIYRAGIWPGYDNHLVGKALYDTMQRQKAKAKSPAPKAAVKLPEPKLVEAGTITLIRGPRRSLWQRIKDFFA